MIPRRYLRLFAFGLLPWLIVLSVPEIRAQLRLQLDGVFANRPDTYYGIRDFDEYLPWYRLRPKPLATIEAERPDDVRVAFQGAERRATEAYVKQYDHGQAPSQLSRQLAPYKELLQRFPRQSWLLASCIRHSVGGFRDDRLAGTFDDTTVPPLAVPPTSTNKPPSFTAAELQRCTEVARLGRKAEPQNCFYDWWLAYYLYAAHRDGEALAVLHEGAQKPLYDDHQREETRAYLYTHSLSQYATAESKVGVIASVSWQEYRAARHFAELLSWRAHEEKARGRPQQALQLVMDVTRLSSTMRRQSYLIMGSLTATRTELISWRGIAREFSASEKKAFLNSDNGLRDQVRLRGNLTLAYARQQGFTEAISLIPREINSLIRDRAAITAWTESQDNVLGLRRDLEKTSMTLWLGCQVILWQILILVVVAIVLLGLAWPLGMERTPVAPRDIGVTTFASLLLFAVALVGMYYGGAGWQEIFSEPVLHGFLAAYPNIGNISGLAALVIPAIVPALLAAGVARLRRLRAPKEPKSTPEGPRPCRAAAAWNALQQRSRERLQKLKAAVTCQTQSAEANWRGLLTPKQFARATVLLSLWLLRIATAVTIICILLATLDQFGILLILDPFSMFFAILDLFGMRPGPAGDYTGYLLGELGLWCIIWPLRARWWQTTPSRCREAHGVLRWYRGTLFTYLLLSGWIYLALSLANLGPRRQSSAEVDAFVLRGEMATVLATFKTKFQARRISA